MSVSKPSDRKGLGASPLRDDRATDAPHGAADSPPSGSISTGAASYAVANDVPEYEHLQPGKPYAIVKDHGRAFEIKDERGTLIYCLWDGCAFLEGGSWRRLPAASGIEAPSGDETHSGSAEGESRAPEGGDAR